MASRTSPWATFECRGKYPKTCGFLWCCTGCIFLLMAIQLAFLPKLLRDGVDNGLKDGMIISSKSSDGYDSFKGKIDDDDDGTSWKEVRFFNVTNPDEVLAGEMPQISITPPMVYLEPSEKYNISFSDDKNWVRYNKFEYKVYDEKRSVLDPDAPITIFSPFLAAVYYGEEWDTAFYNGVIAANNIPNFMFYFPAGDWLFWKGTAKQLLFDDLVLVTTSTLLPANPSETFNMFPGNYNPAYPPNPFSMTLPLALMGNGTKKDAEDAADTFKIINTGYDEPGRMGELKYIGKYGEFVSCWNPAVSIAPGHDDNKFGMDSVADGSEKLAWISQIKRNVWISYDYSYNWNDIELSRYFVQLKPQFDASDIFPPNNQFYMFEYDGVINMTACSSDFPFFVSLPLFLGGDERILADAIEMGLPAPVWEDTMPFIDIEARTGAIFRANKSLQMNTMIHGFYDLYNGTDSAEIATGNGWMYIVDDVVVPMVEFSDVGEMKSSDAEEFSTAVDGTLASADSLDVVGYVGIVFLVLWLVFGTYVCARYRGEKSARGVVVMEAEMTSQQEVKATSPKDAEEMEKQTSEADLL